MKFKALCRRNWVSFSLWLAPAGVFIPICAFMFYSSYNFWLATGYTSLVTAASFVICCFIPAGIMECSRQFAAGQWKKGHWLSLAKRREIRFGKRAVSKTVITA